MTHYLGDISLSGGKRYALAVLEKWETRLRPTRNENRDTHKPRGRNRHYPSIGGLLNESAKSAGATRQIVTGGRSFGRGCLVEAVRRGPVERSETPNAADLPTPDRRQHRPWRVEGGAGETIMRASTPWRQSNRQDPDPALALLAGVVIVAIKDAQRGCADAAAFLSSQDIPENVWRSSRARMMQR